MKLWNPRRGLSFCLAFFCLLMLSASHCEAATPQAFQFVIGQDVDSFEDYVKTFGRVPDGFMAYTSLQDLEGLWSEADHGGGRQHAERLMRQYPQCFMQLGLYLVDILHEIPKGVYDENLARLALWFKVIRASVYLRVGYEFDGPHNRYNSEEYVVAYRYIVDFLRKEGVTNVAYVWHSYAGYVDGGLMQWFPGEEYVDWVGISFFDAYSDGFRDNLVKMAEKFNKPLMIAEASLYRTESKKSRMLWETWYKRYFGFIKRNNVSMVSYINWDWKQYPLFEDDLGWFNSRVQDDPYIKEKWVEELKDNGYIQDSIYP